MPWATTEAWHESHPLSTQSLYDDDIAGRQRRRIRMILLKQRRRRRRRERCTPRRRRGGWCAPVANDCPRLQGSVSIFLSQPPWRLAPLIVDLGFRFNRFVQVALEPYSLIVDLRFMPSFCCSPRHRTTLNVSLRFPSVYSVYSWTSSEGSITTEVPAFK